VARPLRVAYPGAFYHVTSRGNERRKIFLSRRDGEKFLEYLRDGCTKFNVLIHAYILMGNHYHLIAETPQANLSVFMHALNSWYTTYFNIKRKRSGHLFQGRYKALLVDVDSYLLELSRYIHLNPVRAGISEKPEDWLFSSYRSYITPGENTFVFRDLIWGMIAKDRSRSPHEYRTFVESALSDKSSNPVAMPYGGFILGAKPFIKEILQRIKTQDLVSQDTSHRKMLGAIALDMEDIIETISFYFQLPKEKIITGSPYRGYAVYLARKHTALSNAEIGRYFQNISFSAVTKIGTRLKERMAKDAGLVKEIQNVEKALMSRVKG